MAAFYGFTQVQPAPIVGLGIAILPFLTCAWWVSGDARAKKIPFAMDWGLLAWVAWPVLVPWYAWRTRGLRGWQLTLGLYAAIVTPYILAGIAMAFALAASE